MRVIRGLEELRERPGETALAIGNFDGVHRGHQQILRAAVEEARRRGGTAAALTFDPHPAKVFFPDNAPPLLTTLEQRLRLLGGLGMDLAVVAAFTQEFARVEPRRFVEEMVKERLGTRVLCVGENFRFGHRQGGDVALLGQLAGELKFELRVIPPERERGHVISSSVIRGLVGAGRVSRAARLLGRAFSVTGAVRAGAGRGRELHFPTLNIVPEQECVPAYGVYITEAEVGGERFGAATNVGVNPTFDGTELVVESFLLDFDRTVIDERLEVRFLRRLRPEVKFPSVAALREQMERDVAQARRYFRLRERLLGRRRAVGTRNP